MIPGHCGQPMYRDYRDGQDMRRYLCAAPGCPAAIAEDTLTAMAEMAWAEQYGIRLPGVTVIGGEETEGKQP